MRISGCLMLCFLTVSLWGQNLAPTGAPTEQDTPGANQAPAQAGAKAQAPDSDSNNAGSSQKQTNGTSKDRLFFTLPNFLTLENASSAPPLTTAQKFWVTTRGSIDYFTLAWYGALAGVGQAENDDPSHGQGAAGYARRYALRFADGTIENYMTKAILPSLLHQDPRFYQSSKGTFWHRLGYAVDRIVITRSDSGNTQFNFSEIIGSAAAAGISTYGYHPADEKNLSNAVSVWGTQVGYDAFNYVLKEFWPDIRNKLHKSKTGQAP
jgi:hypothetical protein